ncbi:MAG TPA: ABC transporter permease [Acidimicrobiales bacterium]|nr:ABC transporter permease [Acidimicrobiales bacterium]
MSSVAEIVESRELIANLTLRELRGRYKRSVLGWTWSLLNPLSTVVIYSIVFGVLLDGSNPTGDPSGVDNFTVWLLCGLLPWTFFGGSLNGAMGVLTGNASLIRKVYFPREGLVLSFVASMLVTFLIEMGVLLVILVVFGNNIWPWLPLVALLMVVQTVFITGFALALSVLNVYFRDIQYLVGAILLQAWFFLTPIVYPIELVNLRASKPVARLYSWNPMVRYVETYRDLLYDNRGPTLVNTVYLISTAAIVLAIGMAIFRRYESRLAEEL